LPGGTVTRRSGTIEKKRKGMWKTCRFKEGAGGGERIKCRGGGGGKKQVEKGEIDSNETNSGGGGVG